MNILNNADIKLLNLFVVLISERSVSSTAERLAMTQPAVSLALSRLRELFHDPLLLRSGRRMTPTNRALQIESSVRSMLIEYHSLTSMPATFDASKSTRIFVITAPEHVELRLIPKLLTKMRDLAPQVQLEVKAPNPERSFELLENGEIDLRLAWLTHPNVALRSLQCFQDKMVCIAKINHPRINEHLTLQDFLSIPHARTLGARGNTTNRVIDETLRGLGKNISMSFQMQNFATVANAVSSTDMIAMIPYSLAIKFSEQLGLQIVDPPIRLPRIKYAAYWHERSQNDVGHQWLRQLIVKVAKESDTHS